MKSHCSSSSALWRSTHSAPLRATTRAYHRSRSVVCGAGVAGGGSALSTPGGVLLPRVATHAAFRQPPRPIGISGRCPVRPSASTTSVPRGCRSGAPQRGQTFPAQRWQIHGSNPARASAWARSRRSSVQQRPHTRRNRRHRRPQAGANGTRRPRHAGLPAPGPFSARASPRRTSRSGFASRFRVRPPRHTRHIWETACSSSRQFYPSKPTTAGFRSRPSEILPRIIGADGRRRPGRGSNRYHLRLDH